MGKIQSKVVRLEKLLLVEPYKIIGLWSNGEIRINDFSEEVSEWRKGSSKELRKVSNAKTFKTAFVKDGNLAFACSLVNVPGILEAQPVDFDRHQLFNDSQLVGNAVSYDTAIQHQRSRISRRKRSITSAEDKAKATSGLPQSEPELISKLSQKIGTPVTPLVVIGDELVELETSWISYDL